MQRIVILILLLFASLSGFAQNKDTLNISITNYKLVPGTYSWRGNDQFHDMTSWDSSPYLQGHLRQGTQFRMNYRLLLPSGHNSSYKPGYPMIVMLHGAGERGNCWNDNCYCPDAAQCNPNNAPLDGTDPRFLNNDHQLVHGGSPHLSARNRAGTKLPDDPSLAPNAFPGFVLFPQNTNQWRNSGSPASSDVSNAIRIVRLLSRQYNIDQDRIYIHGLSMGAQALLEALNYADWLFAAAAPMSPINFSQTLEYDSVRNIPFWIFQGGQDLNPKPYETEGMIEKLREKGAGVRYSLYPNLGHGTWNTAYAEPDFFSWLLSKNKSNIHVDYGKPNVCATTGEGASLVLPQGFPAYQWERDGEIIPGAFTHSYVATIPGTYRARYSRYGANPTDVQWNRWSDPVTVGERAPESPAIQQLGTNVLSDLNLGSVAYLKVPEGFEKYHWFQNGQPPQKDLVQSPEGPTIFTHAGCTGGGPCVHSGQYTLITEGYDKCPSLPSAPVTILFGTHNTVTVPPAITGTPGNFTFELKSPTSVLLKWSDNSTNERGFEIWRRRLLNEAGEDFNKGWVMATITQEDVTMFLDTGLEPSTTYYYKIRAVNNSGRSNYFPGNTQGNVNHNRVVTTAAESVLPTPPTDVVATTVGPGEVRLTWTASTDHSGISQYYIYFNGDSIPTGDNQSSYTLTSLPVNAEYNFTVKAQDAGGNLSNASNPSNTHTYISGLYYKHSTGAWSSMAEMADTWISPEFTGWVSSFSLQERTQDDFFNFEFQGFLYINTAGLYSFRTTSDDGSQLFLDNVLIVNNDGLHGSTTVTSADQNLAAGPVPIMVRYFENAGGQSLTVQYRGADTGNAWVNISPSTLKSGDAPALPLPPVPPANVSATASGMNEARVTWTYDATKIVILGSSTAFGTGASPVEKSWVNLLATWLSENTVGATVTNLALGGFDTEDVLPSGDAERNITKALSLSPDIIIVNLPSNDVANGIPVSTTINNLKTLRSLAEAQGVRIFFTTTQPRNFGTQAQRDLLLQSAQEIRASFGNYVIDIYDELANAADLTIKAIYNADGIHVNNDGHAYIFDTTKKKILSWVTSFEVQRSLAEAGPFVSAGRSYTGEFMDTGLLPDHTYYYRVRATAIDTVSQFSPIVSARTAEDVQSPSVPGKPVLHRAGYATISITWPASTDDNEVAGYEIYANGILIGTSDVNAFQATGLLPETSYTFTVIAFDAAGNKSAASESLTQATSSGTIFYSQAGSTQLNSLASWKTQAGIAPSSFSDNGQVFVIRHSLPVGAPWTVEGTISKVVIDDGVTISINSDPINATVDINGTGTLNLQSSSRPELGTLSSNSRVRYSTSFVQRTSYGHLELVTPFVVYEFEEGVTAIHGELSMANGASIQGATGNATTLELHGNLSMTGTAPPLANSYAVALHLLRNGNQNITTASDAAFSELIKEGTGSVNILNSGSPITLTLGSSAGGGLVLKDGTSLQLGNNHLFIRGAGNINSSGEKGFLRTAGGNLSLSSTSTSTSHLYFDATSHSVNRFLYDKPGDCFVQSDLSVAGALKVVRGTLHSNGHIAMMSSLGVTANIEAIENDGMVTGAVRIQQRIGETGGTTRYMSPPVLGLTVSDLQNYFPVTGDFTGASPGTANPSLFVYREPSWIGYPLNTNPTPYNTSDAPVESGKGYAAQIHNTSAVLMESEGNIAQGTATFMLTEGGADSGWNFIGNPFPSTIQWNSSAWTSGGINSVATVVSQNNGVVKYDYFDSNTMTGTAETGDFRNGIIAIGQAFMVRTVTSSPTLSVSESAKIPENYVPDETSASHLRITLNNGSATDAAIVVITASGTDAFNPALDGIKRKNEGMFNFSTLSEDGKALAINNSGDEFCAKQIWLDISDAPAGSFTLSVETISTLAGIEAVRLVDHFTNTTTDFSVVNEYSFGITADPSSSGSDRFELILSRADLNLNLTPEVRSVCDEPVRVTLPDTQPGTWYGLFGENAEELVSPEEGNGGDIVMVLDPADVMDGENTIIVKASYPGCSSAELPQAVSFTHYHTPTVTAADVVVCEGNQATLSVTSSASVATYQWFLNGTLIPSNTGSSLVTGAVLEEVYYSVRAVQPDGCRSAEKFITVSPIAIAEPQITQDDDLILTDVAGDEYEWLRNGVTVSVTTEPSYEFTGSGAYSVVVRIGDCSRASAEFIVTNIPDEAQADFSVSVYPNPTGQLINLNVRSRSTEEVNVRMTDVTGRTILKLHFGEPDLQGPITLNEDRTVLPGIYFLSVEQGSKNRIIKVIVE